MIKFVLSLLVLISFNVYSQVAIAPKYDVGIYPSKNFIKNPDAEKNDASVTDANGIHSRSTSSPLEGAASHLIDAGTSGHLVKFTTNAIDAMTAGGNCQAIYYVSGDASLYKTAVFLSSTNLTGAYTQLENVSTGSRKVSLFFPCGASGDQPDIEIQATSNSAAAIKVDGVYLGKCIDCTTATSAEFVGQLTYAGVTSCDWTVTTSSFSNFSADTDCNTPSVTGSVTAPGTKIPGLVVASVKPGTYKITASGNFQEGNGANEGCVWRLSDGTNTTQLGGHYASNQNDHTPTLSGTITYTAAQSNVTFQLQARSDGSNNCNVTNNATSLALVFNVEYFPSSSMQAIRTDCAGSANCENTFSASISSTGTVSGENIDWLSGNCSASTGDYSCTFVAGIFSVIPNCVIAPAGASSSGNQHGIRLESLTTSGFSVYSRDTSNASYAQQWSIVCDRQSSDRKPSMNVPILVGGVTSGASGAERVERAYILNSGTPTVSTQSGNWISSITDTGTGHMTLNLTSGIFSAAPTCVCTAMNSGRGCHIADAVPTTSAVALRTGYSNASGPVNPEDNPLMVICMGPR